MKVIAYAWVWGPLVFVGVMLTVYGGVQAVQSEQRRREVQGLPPLNAVAIIALAAGGALLAAIGFVVFLL